ncbi:MAG TPA: ribosome recycling factor [Acidimicrobiia bacterium]|nr:ribosome recycling factor [Acidimicrobiia bacterium]
MSELSDVVIVECKEKMHKAVEHLQDEFGGIRTGRATPGLVEKLRVDVYGSEVPLQQIAGITVPEPRALAVSPYDRTTLTAIEKAIQQSDLGINPSNDGAVIRLAFPPLTEERRKDLVKVVKQRAEDGRIAVRNVRRQARHDLEELERDGDLSRDQLERIEKDLEKVTHEMVEEMDTLLGHKEQELLEV